MSTLQLDRFAHISSPLQRWDARWKLAAGGLSVAALAALRRPDVAAAALAFALLMVAVARLPVAGVLHRLRAVAAFMLVAAAILAFTGGGAERYRILGLSLSAGGCLSALLMVLKVTAIMLVLLAVTSTSPAQRTLAALRSLGLPGSLVQVLHLVYRYVFLLQDESARVRRAMRARGFAFQFGRRMPAMLGNVVGLLLVRSLQRADRVHLAMQARGFDGTFRSSAAWQTRAGDVIKFAVVALAGAGLLLADMWF